MVETPESYLMDQIAAFHYDPPDSDYQDGYFDALAYMADYFGWIDISEPSAPKPSRPKLTLIQGGLSSSPAQCSNPKGE